MVTVTVRTRQSDRKMGCRCLPSDTTSTAGLAPYWRLHPTSLIRMHGLLLLSTVSPRSPKTNFRHTAACSCPRPSLRQPAYSAACVCQTYCHYEASRRPEQNLTGAGVPCRLCTSSPTSFQSAGRHGETYEVVHLALGVGLHGHLPGLPASRAHLVGVLL